MATSDQSRLESVGQALAGQDPNRWVKIGNEVAIALLVVALFVGFLETHPELIEEPGPFRELLGAFWAVAFLYGMGAISSLAQWRYGGGEE